MRRKLVPAICFVSLMLLPAVRALGHDCCQCWNEPVNGGDTACDFGVFPGPLPPADYCTDVLGATWDDCEYHSNCVCDADDKCTPKGVCGNGKTEAGEQCDGDSGSCPGKCLDDCTCEVHRVPTLPHWGLIGLGAVLFVGGALVFRRRRALA